ncbi:EamA family transporter [Ancylobacter mangrovi]|uniref:EamA family transporter n=1 Tax=Ancylobacter mangrovi TaxID=2972472 RepID=UPI002162C157|nr:EamA family transporter [Ancylobacter mangrovi]MCS0503614.1 EamA family transporter [Ancylobacter mangrovi]
MSRFALVGLILASVALNALAQILLRLGARAGAAAEPGPAGLLALAFQPSVLGGLACYAMSLLLWLYVLGRVEVSFAYPFLALGFVLVALAGWQWLGETMPPARMAGIGIILAGVLVLARS